MEAWFALYEAGGKAAHLERATALLTRMRDSLPDDDARSAFDAADLVQRVRAAGA